MNQKQKGNNALDALNKIACLLSAAQFLTGHEHERELASELIDLAILTAQEAANG
ncbi:hypothetical protein [Hafnia paralvei]|uniref:hypothetical protein n=1 Tax=Hafnia paralvei TaxID=546367 RepID=UPI00187D360E|nr:hypothetical protein [Hafnia paralvei]